MIKKAILFCLAFVFSIAVNAQETKVKKAARKTGDAIEKAADKTEKGVKKATKKTGEALGKAADKTEKGVKKAAKSTEKGVTKAAKATEKGVKKAAAKTDEAVTKTASRIKKDGTPDKRFKKTPAEEKEDMKETTASKSAEKKVKDKATGTYKGKKVFTGPRGGRYYINKNGNKTYLSDDQK